MAESWECSNCTFTNPGDTKDCQVCSTRKNIAKTRATWTCEECTFANELTSDVCYICQRPRIQSKVATDLHTTSRRLSRNDLSQVIMESLDGSAKEPLASSVPKSRGARESLRLTEVERMLSAPDPGSNTSRRTSGAASWDQIHLHFGNGSSPRVSPVFATQFEGFQFPGNRSAEEMRRSSVATARKPSITPSAGVNSDSGMRRASVPAALLESGVDLAELQRWRDEDRLARQQATRPRPPSPIHMTPDERKMQVEMLAYYKARKDLQNLTGTTSPWATSQATSPQSTTTESTNQRTRSLSAYVDADILMNKQLRMAERRDRRASTGRRSSAVSSEIHRLMSLTKQNEQQLEQMRMVQAAIMAQQEELKRHADLFRKELVVGLTGMVSSAPAPVAPICETQTQTDAPAVISPKKPTVQELKVQYVKTVAKALPTVPPLALNPLTLPCPPPQTVPQPVQAS
uniref:RanBP2-type domain-containing protein n=1 Tax=Eutreptiella gymnastica TaxID=73025 RepID=A0A7S1I901_9EUGL|mmetsp:Transcript_139737/g.243223  ORF Transcript_139737/g.243223 Transcript_139737/m.243223 type:complete len:460 (+) Transcript_139737:109-1488(+)